MGGSHASISLTISSLSVADDERDLEILILFGMFREESKDTEIDPWIRVE